MLHVFLDPLELFIRTEPVQLTYWSKGIRMILFNLAKLQKSIFIYVKVILNYNFFHFCGGAPKEYPKLIENSSVGIFLCYSLFSAESLTL